MADNSPPQDEAAKRQARLAFLEREIAWQRGQLESVERDQRKAPYLLVGILLAIPAGFIWGWVQSILVVLGSIALFLSAMYLTAGHRSEYRDKIVSLEKEKSELEHTPYQFR